MLFPLPPFVVSLVYPVNSFVKTQVSSSTSVSLPRQLTPRPQYWSTPPSLIDFLYTCVLRPQLLLRQLYVLLARSTVTLLNKCFVELCLYYLKLYLSFLVSVLLPSGLPFLPPPSSWSSTWAGPHYNHPSWLLVNELRFKTLWLTVLPSRLCFGELMDDKNTCLDIRNG